MIYCRNNAKHPFLEQTYLDVAVFYRSIKKFGESLMMWKKLEALQKHLYGEDNMSLMYTYKNIGTCYLGVTQIESAHKYFDQCIELINNAKSDVEKPEQKLKDRLEIAALN